MCQRSLFALILTRRQPPTGKSRAELVIYDPFFCDGATVRHLRGLGFETVINRNRDFYKDLRDGDIPAHDVLVTNPPYSGDHKVQAIDFAVEGNHGRPWLFLLPNYCVTKRYYTARGAHLLSVPNHIMTMCYDFTVYRILRFHIPT